MIKVIKKGNPKPVVLSLNGRYIVVIPNDPEHNESFKIGSKYYDVSFSEDYNEVCIYEAKNDKSEFASGQLIKTVKLKNKLS